MGLVPKPSLLLLRKPKNKSAALAETNGTLTSNMPESGIQCNELVISSKKLEGMANLNHGAASTHLAPKNLFHSLPMKYVGNLKNSQEGTKTILAHSLFDKFKRQNKDPTSEYRKEQCAPLPMRGILHGTSYSDLCRAGKLSVNFNRSYATCIPKQSGRSQRSTKLTMEYFERRADLGVQVIREVPGILCIGVEDMYCVTDIFKDGETSDPLLHKNMVELEMQPVPHILPSRRAKQPKEAAKIDNECGLTTLSKLELPRQNLPSSSNIKSSSSDPPQIQSKDDLSVIINKSEMHSPVSVLDQLFEDASPKPADDTAKPVKLPIRPHRINYEERSPVKSVKFHSDTKSRFSIPPKKHTSSALEYARKVLESSGLNWYQLALKWNCSTQILDTASYTELKSQPTSKAVTPIETRLLLDHINEVLMDIYQPYNGIYPWVPHSRPTKAHFVTERDFFDEIIRILEMNLSLRQDHIPEQKLVINSMEKSGTWIDTRRDIEDMVFEIVEEVAEELVEEFVFEMWID